MRDRRGFSLIELMVVTSALGAVILAATALVGSIRSTERFSAEYTGDLAGMRRAVAAIEADLREATDVTDLEVRLDGDRLVEGDRVLARNVAVFEATRDGPLARVRVGLGSRSSSPSRRSGEIRFAVLMRGAESPR